MKVSIKAQIFIASNLEREEKKFCLFSVLSGGCNGMQYNVTFVDILPDYEVIEISKNIYIDPLSLDILKNSVLDVAEGLGYSKIIIKNPNAVSSCSCGSSFSI